MVFKDIIPVVGLNSLHSKKKLIGKSPNKKNIKVHFIILIFCIDLIFYIKGYSTS